MKLAKGCSCFRPLVARDDVGEARCARCGRAVDERRYGELLGPAENRGPATLTASKGSTSADHAARHKARVVASVPEPTFTEYVDNEPAPSRAGLLCAADKLAGSTGHGVQLRLFPAPKVSGRWRS